MKTQRIDYIDGLKGISAIIVVLHHLLLAFRCAYPPLEELNHIPFINILFSGNYAVFLFVLLSSVLTEYRLHEKLSLEICQKTIVKRYFRIMIPVAVVLVIMAIMKIMGLFYHLEFAQLTGNEILAQDKMEWINLPKVILMSPLGRSYEWLGVLWMLNYVFLGTFVCVVFAIALHNVSYRCQIAIFIFSLLISYVYDTLYASVVLGFVMARLLLYNNFRKWGGHLCLVAAVVLIVIIELLLNSLNLNIFLAAATFMISVSSAPVRHFLESRPLVLLGRISFEIYLVHDAVIYSLVSYLALKMGVTLNTIFYIWILALVFTCLCAYWLHKYIEPYSNKATTQIVEWIMGK